MSSSQRFLSAVPQSVEFLDHSSVEWGQVRRSQYWIYQRFHYEYPGPIRDLHQRLVVVPPARHGDQYLSGHKLRVTISEACIDTAQDSFGNSVYYLDLPEVESTVDFEVWSSIERTGPSNLPIVAASELGCYLEPTILTAPDPVMEAVARDLSAQTSDPWRLADLINDWVWAAMRYTSGMTHVGTSASEALELGQGLCQDYSHIMLTLCRLVGLPARYVSGHLLGEGGSHAWIEVLLPSLHGSDYVAVAYDPTNHCRASWRHLTIAAGRDYRDVSPTSGHFTAPYSGRLLSSKRAGLISVEYFDGEIVTVNDTQLDMLEEVA